MMKVKDLSLVGWGICFQRDEVILLFSYHFSIWIYWFLYISFFQDEESLGREEVVEAMGLEEDLDAVGLEDTSDGRRRGGGRARGWCRVVRWGVGVTGLL
jgi:hypothetical protein